MSQNNPLGIQTSTDVKPKEQQPSFFKRPLPDNCIAFNSPKGKEIFKSALEHGMMESYFSLALHFTTQREPAYCSLASLAMVANSLEIDPKRQFKGVWRFFDDEMLDCCRPLEEIKARGITLSEFLCLARCNGLSEESVYADGVDSNQGYKDFLAKVKETSSLPTTQVLVLSYNRATLGQTGTGHFSPIGGYDPVTNSILILDVARFKYPAHWVDAELVWKSLYPIDPDTGRSRGYVILKPSKETLLRNVLVRLSTDTVSWPTLASSLFEIKLEPDTPPQQVIEQIIKAIPAEFDAVADTRWGLGTLFHPPNASDEERLQYQQSLKKLLKAVTKTKLYEIISNSTSTQDKIQSYQAWQQSSLSLINTPLLEQAEVSSPRIRRIKQGGGVQVSDFSAFLTIFIAAFLPFIYDSLSTTTQSQLQQMVQEMDVEELKWELENLRQQMRSLNVCWKEACCKMN